MTASNGAERHLDMSGWTRESNLGIRYFTAVAFKDKGSVVAKAA